MDRLNKDRISKHKNKKKWWNEGIKQEMKKPKNWYNCEIKDITIILWDNGEMSQLSHP